MRIESGDTALVTGGSRGMGLHIVRALARRGVRLVIAARSAEALAQVQAELRQTGAEVATVVADLGDRASVEALAEAATRAYGRIDILVNNAGVETALAYEHRSLDDIEQTLAINLGGPLLLTRLLLPQMLQNGRGHIVSIASAAGVIPTAYEEPYAASKAGLVAFMRSLRLTAQDCGWPVGASVICPGFMTGTGMYENTRRSFGGAAPKLAGTMDAAALGDAVIRAVERDLPDLYLMPGPARLNAATGIVAPRFFEWLMRAFDVAAFFRNAARQRLDQARTP